MFNIGRNKKIEELEKIIDEYQDQLYSFAFYRVGSFDIAQDIVQDTFIKLYHNYPKLSEVRNIKSYLMKIISNKCIDYKRQLKHPLSLEAALLKEDESARPLIEEFFSINDVLRELPDEQSEVVTMHLVDDLSFVEISSILEISVNTIKSRYKYAIEKLKKSSKFKEYEYDE